MEIQPLATYAGPTGKFVADTCAPLRQASDANEVKMSAYGRGTYPGVALEADALPQLKSVGTWEATCDQQWGLDWHRNEGIEISCLTAGSLDFSCESEEYDLVAGDLTIMRPWQLHRVGRPNVRSSTLTWFIIDVDVRRPNQEWVWPSWLPIPASDLARLTELLSHNERPVWRANKALLSAVTTLERTLRGQVSQPMARIATATTEVLIELRDLLENETPVLNPYLSSTERTVRWFITQLPDRISEPWTVEQMAGECGLGRTRFVHHCRQILNISPLEHLNALRLTQAADLLSGTDLRMSDIAHACGFASSQYFATCFRRRFNRTPVEYRQHCRSVALA
ncbi:AraC family transcriptional regulator [Planctomonas psychrotolerans]|uniref:AraC family transcriptional regulator n=1 Tax=Planctomonas psychrotolerans TaxID=2528712 RepID=UPI00123BA55C|nr:AraC family transcriptional regulator [Planctomonas psychrotolerans]